MEQEKKPPTKPSLISECHSEYRLASPRKVMLNETTFLYIFFLNFSKSLPLINMGRPSGYFFISDLL